MSVNLPRPRPLQGVDPATLTAADARRLTAPEAFALYCGVVGYRLPRHLNSALRLSDALRKMP